MKTKKILGTIDVMTENVVKELNDMNEKIDGKANHSYVQTIAKHLMNLEARVDDLEKENSKPDIADDIRECSGLESAMLKIFGSPKHTLLTKLGEIEFILNPKTKSQTDYFLKAKNLLIEYAEKTMIKKGMEYTPIGDRFANFRPILGEKKTALEKLIGYNAKHVQYCFMQESNMTAKTTEELLEHWGDVFNYNVLGLAMGNTDKPDCYLVRYADRVEQEKEIKDIVDSVKVLKPFTNIVDIGKLYTSLLGSINLNHFSYIIFLFAKQLERLECK